MKYNVTGWLIAAIAAMIAGPVFAYTLEAFGPALTNKGVMTLMSYGWLAIAARVLSLAPQALISALWVAKVARRENENVLLWCLFALGFGIIAVAVFFGVLSYKRSLAGYGKVKETGPNQSPEVTPGKRSPASSSASFGAPQL